MSFLTSKKFWVATAERAIKTFAQAGIALLTGDTLGILSVDWANVGQVSVLAALVSVLTSIASGAAPVGPVDSPSITKEV